MSSNTAMKRLTEIDVKAIFTSVAKNQQPTERLKFKIIRVPQDGLKLSPPSFELDDGLYVLLRSPKNKLARVPSELTDWLLTDNDLAALPNCPWSLSGPQFPKRAQQKVQQRYCYPRGNGQYSIGKGGAMWTMIDSKGNESNGIRILHVYHSQKRAGTSAKPTSQDSKKLKGVAPRQSKRKNSGGGQENNKRTKAAATTIESVMKGDLVKSPPPSQMSFDLDSNLDFNSDNLFEGNCIHQASINQSFSFMPTVQSNIDDMVWNNPAFNSAAARPSYGTQYQYAATHGYYHGQWQYPPHSCGGWTKTAPSIPELTSSAQTANEAGKGNISDFSSKLKQMEESILSDIKLSKSTDQALKLHLLQNWAKDLAQKPLQQPPQKTPALEPTTTTSSCKQAKIKIESPGTPSITP